MSQQQTLRGRLRPERSSAGAIGRWLVNHPVEVVFAAALTGAFVHLLGAARDAFFVFGDWRLLGRHSVRGILEPYNDHMSVTILTIYRALGEVFGLSYAPFRVAGLVCLVAVPLAYFVTTRRGLGAPLAAIAALSMLAFGNIELYPEVLNHYLVLVGAIGCAAALNRGPRADKLLAASLALALSAAAGGLAVAAACLVHNAFTRPPIRRWLAVLGPSTLWGIWWVGFARDSPSRFRPAERPSPAEALGYAREIVWAPFAHLSGGNLLLGAALALAFALLASRRARQGLVGSANLVAWSTAAGIWAVGLAYTRGSWIRAPFDQGEGVYFRYQLLALGFGLLAVVPPSTARRVPLSAPVARRVLAATALAILLGAWARGLALRDDIQFQAGWIEGYGRNTRGALVALGLGPELIGDDANMGAGFAYLTAGEVRELVDRYGPPLTSTPEGADKQLVELGIASAQRTAPGTLPCTVLTEPLSLSPGRPGALRLWSDSPSWEVSVRRFGKEWVTLARAPADSGVTLRLPDLGVALPWQVRADGACASGPVG